MATNYNNDKIISYSSEVNTAPDKYTTLTGNFSTTGVMVYGGGGSLFTTEIASPVSGKIGNPSINNGYGYLFNNVNEVRKIKQVISDTILVLENAFTVDFAGAVKYVPPSRSKQMSFVQISGTVIIDGVALSSSEGSGWGDTANQNMKTLDPIVIDASGGSIHISKFTAN